MKAPSFDVNRSCLGEILPLNTPFRLILDSSEACNFKCTYCFRSVSPSETWGYAVDNGIMSMETFGRAVQQILKFPEAPRVISLSGMGEPLCNKNIPLMAKRLKELGITSKIEIHTNASLLTQESAKVIASCGIDKVVVSLQGLDAEAYKKVCAFNLNFDTFYKNLEILYKNKTNNLEVNIKIVDEALRDAKEEEKFYAMFSPIADKTFIENTIALWQEQIVYDETSNNKSNKFGEDFGEIICCPITFLNLTISPGGDIYPCCVIDPPFSLGNVKDTELTEAWNSSRRKDFLRSTLINGRKSHKRCETCYFPKGYVKTEADIIDGYRQNILERID
ncbi:radical SAM/SPASM domain-containing protein [Desulfitobacterium sp. PCE1]|uniref:radical SAM/SPASM domain-containing protein n=1 Tax=Desulfitobacterium sp. PCE1 TaxID=146907 RepID=UPI00039C9840|nr:radical SAM protein [Desulfitobacterium sp. PCE1]